MTLDSKTVDQLFTLIRENTATIAAVQSDVKLLLDVRERKDEDCEKHEGKTEKLETRVSKLELWRASQAGITGLVKDYGPLVMSGLAIYFSLR